MRTTSHPLISGSAFLALAHRFFRWTKAKKRKDPLTHDSGPDLIAPADMPDRGREHIVQRHADHPLNECMSASYHLPR